VDEDLVFVIISFDKKFNNVFKLAIEPAVEKHGLKALKANGEDKVQRNIYDDIADKLELAKLVIVDISKVKNDKGSDINLDNVYYELGLAHGINKRFIFLTQDAKTDIPFDLKNLSATIYDPDDLDKLKKDLIEIIPKALNEEPIKFFKNIEIINKKEPNKEIGNSQGIEQINQNVLSIDITLLNNLYKIIGESNVQFNISEISDAMRMKLRKLFASDKDFIEIKFYSLENKSVRHIRITENGLNYLAENN
jgi:hypothetical protein